MDTALYVLLGFIIVNAGAFARYIYKKRENQEKTKIMPTIQNNKKVLLIYRVGEDIEWINNIKHCYDEVYVYNSDNNYIYIDNINVIQIKPNETYEKICVDYIIDNYNNLPKHLHIRKAWNSALDKFYNEFEDDNFIIINNINKSPISDTIYGSYKAYNHKNANPLQLIKDSKYIDQMYFTREQITSISIDQWKIAHNNYITKHIV